MRKYTYILQTHNPDKKYVVDNIAENISYGYIVDNIARKSTLSTMLWRVQSGWYPRCNTTKKVDADNCYKINWLTSTGRLEPVDRSIATDRDADVSIHIVKSGQSLEHCNGIENSRLAIIHVGPSFLGLNALKYM